MRFLLRLPLHWQILLAMVLGTSVGVFVNPGEQRLADLTLEVVPENGGVRMAEVDAAGVASFVRRFPDAEAFRRAYPELAAAFEKQKPRGVLRIAVSDRSVHFSEDGERISIRYTRRYGKQRVVSTPDAADRDELARRFPHLLAAYDEYAAGMARRVTISAKVVGDLFLRLLRMITVPLIVCSLVTGVAGLGQTSRLGTMFVKTVAYYLTTSVLAIVTGLAMVNLIRPGLGADLPGLGDGEAVEGARSLVEVFLGLVNNMIPPNPVHALANGEFLSIITFSILIGFFILRVGGRSGDVLREFFEAGFHVMMRMTEAIIALAPIGVLAFMTFAAASQGLEVFRSLGWYMLTVFLGLAVHAVITLPLILLLVARRSPWKYAQAMSPALLTAFSTASSNGTLPLTMTSAEERAGISNRVSSFVLPLGATINMDGTALYEAVAVLFIAQAYHGAVLPLEAQILVAVTALAASVGAAGIPHAGLVMMAIVLQAVELPIEAQGLIIAVDRVLDMGRTCVNVWSDSCGCAVVERLEQRGPSVAQAAAVPESGD